MTATTHIAAPQPTPQQLVTELHQLHNAQMAAAKDCPDLYEQAHAFLDVDDDTCWPLHGDLYSPASEDGGAPCS